MSLCLLKLGGSLITDKDKRNTPDLERLNSIAAEIATALREIPDLNLVIGHGSGSFGHHAAKLHHTRDGVSSPEEWRGFAHVWERAHALNKIVIDSLVKANIPVISFSPSCNIVTLEHKIQTWDSSPLKAAIDNHLVPLIYGDVVFDQKIGGTILSTEELFLALSRQLTPNRILIAGTEPGVWNNYLLKDRVLSQLSPGSFSKVDPKEMISSSPDVTGGMGSKVAIMLEIAQLHPSTEITIFSGLESGNIYSSLIGKSLGTQIIWSERG